MVSCSKDLIKRNAAIVNSEMRVLNLQCWFDYCHVFSRADISPMVPCLLLRTIGSGELQDGDFSWWWINSLLSNWWQAIIRTKQLSITNYNTRSTQKSPVRQQNAWFDTKKPGSTQKCPVRHKNALPSMHQLTLPLSNIPRPSCEKYFFPILFQYFVVKNQ